LPEVAGTLRRGAGAEEEVAVKVIDVSRVTLEQVALARRELRVMAAVSRALAGYVFRMRGFCEQNGQLLLALELADATLAAACTACRGGRLNAANWVCSPCVLTWCQQWLRRAANDVSVKV
jgi:hypothetical protein